MEEHNQKPELPNDLLRMIFGELSTEDRAPLGSSCKRFRKEDFETGRRKFDSIEVQWINVGIQMIGHAAGAKYLLRWTDPESFQDSFHNLRLFRNACTEKISITYHKSANHTTQFQIISRILRTMTYKKICMHINANQECSQDLIGFFFTNPNMMNSQVYISWMSDCSSESFSFETIHAQLMQLPRLEKLYLAWQSFNAYAEGHPDNAMLLHFAHSTNHVEFGLVNCSAKGVLDVLEVVCESPISDKFISFALPNTGAEGRQVMVEFGLLTYGDPRFRKYRVEHGQGLIDRQRQTILEASHSTVRTVVKIGKMDAQGCLLRPNVSWV